MTQNQKLREVLQAAEEYLESNTAVNGWGLLIRRSLVRAQVGEPKLAKCDKHLAARATLAVAFCFGRYETLYETCLLSSGGTNEKRAPPLP